MGYQHEFKVTLHWYDGNTIEFIDVFGTSKEEAIENMKNFYKTNEDIKSIDYEYMGKKKIKKNEKAIGN